MAAETAGTGVTAHALHPGELASRMWAEIADRAGRDPRLTRFAAWATATGQAPDDPMRAARLVCDLLDDATAARLHGCFLWPAEPDRPPDPLV